MAFFALFTVGADAHAAWGFPNPRSPDTNIKTYPCGTFPYGSTTNPSTLAPGPQLLRFVESINHNGAPTRVALTFGDDSKYDQYVLLDHIPHNDNNMPLTGLKQHVLNVTIPNVSCTSCALQLLSIMTDKIPAGTNCNYPTGANTCLSVYHSCADVKITGTAPNIPAITRTVTPYTQESSAWTWSTSLAAWYLPSNCPGCNTATWPPSPTPAATTTPVTASSTPGSTTASTTTPVTATTTSASTTSATTTSATATTATATTTSVTATATTASATATATTSGTTTATASTTTPKTATATPGPSTTASTTTPTVTAAVKSNACARTGVLAVVLASLALLA